MAYIFTSEKPKDIKKAIENIKQLVSKGGGAMNGDDKRGQISVYGVGASYRVGEEIIEVTIHKKPAFLTNEYIEKTLKKIFRKATDQKYE